MQNVNQNLRDDVSRYINIIVISRWAMSQIASQVNELCLEGSRDTLVKLNTGG